LGSNLCETRHREIQGQTEQKRREKRVDAAEPLKINDSKGID